MIPSASPRGSDHGGVKVPAGHELTVEILKESGQMRAQRERALLASGVPLPLSHRDEWLRFQPLHGSWLLTARDTSGVYHGGFAIAVHRSRLFPWQHVLKAERLGASLGASCRDSVLSALVHEVRKDSRVMRVVVQVFAREPVDREALTSSLSAFGFRRAEHAHCYSHTIAVDLTQSDDALFASFGSSARRNIKAIAKYPVTLREITDPALERRLNDLVNLSMSRTGGPSRSRDWSKRIEFSARFPNLSRIVGLFRNDATNGPESLVAFVWGRNHGDHVEYEAGACARMSDLRIPLTYALVWDLIQWAKRNGATWFDMGGVTQGSLADGHDRLSGISDFKRHFSQQVVQVGEEWVLEPDSLRAQLGRFLRRRTSWLVPRHGTAR